MKNDAAKITGESIAGEEKWMNCQTRRMSCTIMRNSLKAESLSVLIEKTSRTITGVCREVF
jgi:hypothetical protein